jgi:hypothetical protein
MEDDLIIGDPEPETENDTPGLDIIDNQLFVITTVSELDSEVYTQCMDDKVRVIVRALKIIHKIQGNILKDI